METIISLLAIFVGLLFRLAVPIILTVLLVILLREMDARWQVEAQIPAAVEKPECWKIKGCTSKQMAHCKGAASPLPCWQAFRLPNGYMREECLSCKVFIDAPIPSLKIEPRRM